LLEKADTDGLLAWSTQARAAMKQDQLDRWKETRKQGALRYIFVRGLLPFGAPVAIVIALLMHHQRISPGLIGLSALLWCIGGAFIGIAMWSVQERLYRRARGSGS
jgi:hypothetical protein